MNAEWSLHTELDALTARLTALGVEKKRQRAQEKSWKRAEKQKRRNIEDVCFVLYARTVPDSTMALKFVAREAAAKAVSVPMNVPALENRYLETDVATLVAITIGSGGVSKGLLNQADRYHKDYDLHTWIQRQNDLKGVKALTALVLKHWVALHTAEKSCAPTGRRGRPANGKDTMGAAPSALSQGR